MITTVFTSGDSQAVHIPHEFRFEGNRVEIERQGTTHILKLLPASHANTWPDGYLESLSGLWTNETLQRQSQGAHRDLSF